MVYIDLNILFPLKFYRVSELKPSRFYLKALFMTSGIGVLGGSLSYVKGLVYKRRSLLDKHKHQKSLSKQF